MKRVALVIFSLLYGICFSGCFLIKESINKSEKADKLEKQICEIFEVFAIKILKMITRITLQMCLNIQR